MKEREKTVLNALNVFKQLVPSPDVVTYSILSISQQIQTIVGQAFMSNFDYKGILESVFSYPQRGISHIHRRLFCYRWTK